MSNASASPEDPPAQLPQTQKLVLQLIDDEHTAAEAAAIAGLTINEVAEQLARVRRELGVRSTRGAIIAARAAGLLT